MAWAEPLRTVASCSEQRPVTAADAFKIIAGAAPIIIHGLINGEPRSWLPDGVLSGNHSVRIVANPTAVAPLKLRRRTLVRPAELHMTLDEAVEALQDDGRKHYSYVSALPLERLPLVRDALPLRRVLHLAGSRLQHANLWLNPAHRSMKSALHYDGHDNLLVQLRGYKEVLLLPPEAHGLLGYTPREDRMYSFDADASAAFPAHVRRSAFDGPTLENHASLDVFNSSAGGEQHLTGEEEERAQPSAETWQSIAAHAQLCALRPGETLFLPALWSHAVISHAERRVMEGGRAEGDEHSSEAESALPINVAINLWFYSEHSTASFDRAIRPPAAGWPHAHYCLAEALQHTGRLDEAAARYEAAIVGMTPEAPHWHDAHLNLGSTLMGVGGDAQWTRAEEAFRYAAASRPTFAASSIKLGLLMRRLQRLDEACEHYAAARQLAPSEADPHLGLGSALAMLSRLPEAVSSLERAITLSPASGTASAAYNSLGVIRDEQERTAEALSAFDSALRLRPGWEKARENRKQTASRRQLPSRSSEEECVYVEECGQPSTIS